MTNVRIAKKGIYSIKNKINDKCYVGSSINIEKRISAHVSMLDSNKHHNCYLQNDWNKFGSDSFVFETLEVSDDEKDLPYREKYWIDEMNAENGVYNINDPLGETITGRSTLEKLDKGRSNKNPKYYSVTKEYIIDYLNEKFKDEMGKLKNHINVNIFFNKEKLDKWFIGNIQNDNILNDDRLNGLLNKWYNKNGLHIVQTKLYKKQLEKLSGREIDFSGYVLVEPLVSQELYSMKFRR